MIGICVMCSEEYADLGDLTIPAIKQYAARIGADFFVHPLAPACPYPSMHYQKIDMLNSALARRWDRILSMDIDILVNPHAADIFASHPEGNWLFNEYNADFPIMDVSIAWSQEQFGKVSWPPQTYYNSGVMLFERRDLERFLEALQPPYASRFHHLPYGNLTLQLDMGEQDQFNWVIQRLSLEVGSLSHAWNYGVHSSFRLTPDAKANAIITRNLTRGNSIVEDLMRWAGTHCDEMNFLHFAGPLWFDGQVVQSHAGRVSRIAKVAAELSWHV